MQATYEATDLKYDRYQMLMANAVVLFGDPNHMTLLLNSLHKADIEQFEGDLTDEIDKNQLILRRIEAQYRLVDELTISRILNLFNEIGMAEGHRQRAYDDVNMLLAQNKNHAANYEIDVSIMEQNSLSKLEQKLDEYLPLN